MSGTDNGAGAPRRGRHIAPRAVVALRMPSADGAPRAGRKKKVNAVKLDGYSPEFGHEPNMTPPCSCGFPLIKSDTHCPRCRKGTGR